MSWRSSRERFESRRGILAAAVLAVVVAAPSRLAAQMCETSVRPAGSILVALGDVESIRWPTLGVRLRPGDTWWVGAAGGGTAPDIQFVMNGSDTNGNYVGEHWYTFVGVRGEAGWGHSVGSVSVCSTGRISYSRRQATDLTKYYYNSFGQTIAIGEESLDLAAATHWRGQLELSGDYLVSETLALGVALFGGRSSLSSPDTPTASMYELGFAVGGGAILWRGLWLEARYDHPFWDDADSSPRDGWLSGAVGWIF